MLSEGSCTRLVDGAVEFKKSVPFNHIVIDDFFELGVADSLSQDFPDISKNAAGFDRYINRIENKLLCNKWNEFNPSTYQALTYLCSSEFVALLKRAVSFDERDNLTADVGLHGGGQHVHSNGGFLNTHMDYSVHPKLGIQRKFNLIIYLSKEWEPSWGGGLGLWSHDPSSNQPLSLIKTIEPRFNRAVIFDTTQNSWHGLPDPITCPPEYQRQSLALYYLTSDLRGADFSRLKARFAPSNDQKNDPEVLDLIRKRGGLTSSKDVYE